MNCSVSSFIAAAHEKSPTGIIARRASQLNSGLHPEQSVQLPNPVGKLCPHGWRAADRRMNPAEVVVEDMQRHGSLEVRQLL
jgi:hypothetical protein